MRTEERPSPREFRRLARRFNLVPVVREILFDLDTPVSAFRRLAADGGPSFLLESVAGGETWGRYSILGAAPAGRFRSFGDRVEIDFRGRRRRHRAADPLVSLSKWLRAFRPAPVEGLPRFFGGAVGAMAYESVRRMAPMPHLAPLPAGVEPELDLLLVLDLVVFDNLTHTLKLVACAPVEDDPDAALEDARRRLDALQRALEGESPADGRASVSAGRFRSEARKSGFMARVKAAKEYIAAGDVFQVVLSHQLQRPLRCEALDVYRAMRCINPSPYMYYLDFGDRQVLGTSPEVLVRVEGDRATVRPIAGTRRRGADAAEDRARIEDLLGDEKERAEHVMLVDLGRNDLGRVCAYGSVETADFMTVEKYSHVIHLVSQVEGRLRDDADCFDALRAAFPAGTVSGAPKVRAMEIIEELEGRRRGIYAGSVGYFSFDGAMDTCIAIRTLETRDGVARLGVGAGIVLDSDPAREWEETMEKAGAADAAFAMAERGLIP